MGMQMEREQTVTKLLELAKTEGIVFALYGVFGNAVRVLLPVSAKACNTELDELEFSVRASNAFGFIELNDGSYFKNLQIVFNFNFLRFKLEGLFCFRCQHKCTLDVER